MFRIVFDFRKKIFPAYLVNCVMGCKLQGIARFTVGMHKKSHEILLIFVAVFYRKHFVVPLTLIYIRVACVRLLNTCLNDTRKINRSQGMRLGKEFIEREGQNAHFIDRMFVKICHTHTRNVLAKLWQTQARYLINYLFIFAWL